jgi:hypothetical protein
MRSSAGSQRWPSPRPPARCVPVPSLFSNAHLNNALWRFAFNRLAAVNDQLDAGREEIYFGRQFTTKAARPLPEYAVRHYIGTLAADPAALHAGFAMTVSPPARQVDMCAPARHQYPGNL